MNEITTFRGDTQPHNTEAEQQVLGIILLHNDHLERANVTEASFYDPVHAELFKRMKAKIEAGELVSPVTMKSAVEGITGLSDLGGPRYLVRLAAAAISAGSIGDYGALVGDLSAKRAILNITQEATARIMDGSQGAAEIGMWLEMKAGAVLSRTSARRLVRSFLSAATSALDQINDAYMNERPPGTPTGIRQLDRQISNMRPGQMIVLGGRPSMGKAQPLDEPVLTLRGWVKMGDLRIGDQLASVDGQPSVVTGIFPQGVRPVSRVTFSDGRWTRCCPDHLWTVESCSRFHGQRIVSTQRLGEMVRMRRYKSRLWVPSQANQYGKRPHSALMDAWLLGYLLGNGGLTRDSVIVSTADPEMISRIAAAIGPDHTIAHVDKYDYRITGNGQSNEVLNCLRLFRLSGKGSHEKFVPQQFLHADQATRLGVLRGLMDSDGWVEKHGTVRFASSSRKLAEHVAYLARSLGGTATINTKETFIVADGVRTQHRDSHVVNIRMVDASTIFTLRRKAERVKRRFEPHLNVVSVEPDGEAEQQCIAVSHPSQLYITRDFIVTHNTSVAQNIALNVAEGGRGVFFGSLEMVGEELAPRMISRGLYAQGLDVPYSRMLRGELTPDEMRAYILETKRQADLPILIGEREVRDVAAFRSAARRAQQSFADTDTPLGLIVVDYVQQLATTEGKSTYDRASAGSDMVKTLAMQMGVPVLALAQLSRAVEMRDPPVPNLSDLRETGKLEEDADVVIFCYRDSYYLERKIEHVKGTDTEKENDLRAKLSYVQDQIDLIVAKQRSGAIGTVTAFASLPHCHVGSDRVGHDPQGQWALL